MRKTGVAAARWMARMRLSETPIKANRCLQYCRLAWDLPAQDFSAWDEWQSIPVWRKHSDPKTAPVGAPHFWKSPFSRHGHIALQSEYVLEFESTDAPKKGFIGLVSLAWFKKHWRSYKYLGWSEELQGRKLPLNSMPKVRV